MGGQVDLAIQSQTPIIMVVLKRYLATDFARRDMKDVENLACDEARFYQERFIGFGFCSSWRVAQ